MGSVKGAQGYPAIWLKSTHGGRIAAAPPMPAGLPLRGRRDWRGLGGGLCDYSGQPFRQRQHLAGVLPFHHHPDNGLGAGGTQHDAS